MIKIAHASHPYTLPSRSKRQRTNQNLSKSMAAQTHGKIANPNKTKIRAQNEHKCLKINKGRVGKGEFHP
jgi:hypothetical protein